MGKPRLAVVCDYPEEGWPSMDLAAEMLLEEWHARHADQVAVMRVCPAFRRRVGRLPWLGRRPTAFNADRLLNRHWDYPRYLRRQVPDADLFHLCDHSYAQLVHVLPTARTGVFCHDLDTFRCLLEPQREPRPRWFRAVARHVLRGLQRAAVVFYTTRPVREQIERHGLLDPARLVQAPCGVSPEFVPTTNDAGPSGPGLPQGVTQPFLLHVGSCIPRKRVDVLLEVFAAVRGCFPDLRLVQIGGAWTSSQLEQLERLGTAREVTQLRGLARRQLAACYGAAALVLQPSEAEGFGLPVVEALACGAIVVASDIPVLREVGGDAAVYQPVGNVAAWAGEVLRLLRDLRAAPPRSVRLAQAARFSWEAHTRTVLGAYLRLADHGQI
jgi:glycosyltransferase involved in cell wall biosynthesis